MKIGTKKSKKKKKRKSLPLRRLFKKNRSLLPQKYQANFQDICNQKAQESEGRGINVEMKSKKELRVHNNE
jgi:hypothetical protein